MAVFLLDTNVISELVRSNPKVQARYAATPAGDRVVICPIVRGEVLHGILKMQDGGRRRALQAQIDLLLGRIPCESVLPNVADHYAVLKQARRVKGMPLDENDLWIAATAIAIGAILVTHDQDFSGSPGLVTQDWSL